MSKLSELSVKIHTLSEIESIFGAMKNLAIIEMTKVSKLMSAQLKASNTIDDALTDFESFFQSELTERPKSERILALLIGSERGFCGPFNERIIERFRQAAKNEENVEAIVVGRKLAMKLGCDSRVKIQLDGPNSADDISNVINELATHLLSYADCRWMFIHNDGSGLENHDEISFPLECRVKSQPKPFITAPILNMQAQDLYPQLLEQHLFSIMHRALYSSFLAENRERLHHMEGALNKIEKDQGQLVLKLNGQRQEEITEELEILMLSSINDPVRLKS